MLEHRVRSLTEEVGEFQHTGSAVQVEYRRKDLRGVQECVMEEIRRKIFHQSFRKFWSGVRFGTETDLQGLGTASMMLQTAAHVAPVGGSGS